MKTVPFVHKIMQYDASFNYVLSKVQRHIKESVENSSLIS
jgi:hypothetical protein